MKNGWIDISVGIRSGMPHWPGNPPVQVERMLDMSRGDICNVSNLSLGAHTGTHMDAPLHFVRDGMPLEQMPLDATIGPARVIEVKDTESIKPKHLGKQRIRRGERILFKTPNSRRCWRTDEFVKDFVFISKEAAAMLAELRVQTIGVDYLSVGGFFKDGVETHHHLLGAGIWLIEGLNLSEVRPGRYDLVCLPLKLIGGDGAPARAALRRRP
jgi:arylformamidase